MANESSPDRIIFQLTTGVDEAQQVVTLADNVEKTGEAYEATQKKAEAFDRGVAQSIARFKQQRAEQEKGVAAVKAFGTETVKTTQAVVGLSNTIGKAGANMTALASIDEETANVLKPLMADADKLGDKAVEVGGDFEFLKRKAEEAGKAGLSSAGARISSPTAPTPAGAPVPVAGPVVASPLPDLEAGRKEVETFAQAMVKLSQTGTITFDELKAAAKGELDTLRLANEEAAKTPAGQKALAADLDNAQKEALDLLVTTKAITAEERQTLEVSTKLANAARNVGKETAEAAKVPLGKEVQKAAGDWVSLRRQMQQAKAALDAALEGSDGKVTPEIIELGKRAGELQDRFEDLQATVSAFNPDKKFAVFAGVIQNVAGAFTALQGVMGLVGAESEGVQKGLLKVQSALAVTQGLQALFGGLKDNLKNLRLLLISTAGGQRILAAATVQTTAAQGAQTVATSGLSRALNICKVAAVELWAALAANPIVLIVAAAAVLVATIIALANANDKARISADDLLATLERIKEVNAFDIGRDQREAALENEQRHLEEVLRLEKERAAIPSTLPQEQKDLANLRIDQKLAALERKKQAQETALAVTTAERSVQDARERAVDIENQIKDLYERNGVAFINQQQLQGKAAREALLSKKAANEQEALAGAQRVAFDLDAAKQEIEDLDKYEAAYKKVQEEIRDGESGINAEKLKGRTDTLKGEIALTKERKRMQDELLKRDEVGSIDYFEKQLAKLRKTANALPQDAFSKDVTDALQAAIGKAEADLARAKQSFIDTSAQVLAEEKRSALAVADLQAQALQTRLKAQGAGDEAINQATRDAAETRMQIEIDFAQRELELLKSQGKLTEEDIIERTNRIKEAQAGFVNTRATNAVGDTTDRRAALSAELAEEERHALAIADLDTDTAQTRARIAGKSESDLQAIIRQGNIDKLKLQLDYARKQLDILIASGTATKEEITKQQNAILELEGQLAAQSLGQSEDAAAARKKAVDDIISAADQIAQAGIQAWQAWSDAAQRNLDFMTQLQEKRVQDAEELADKGNAVILEKEKERLQKLTDERRKAAERNSAIAQVEAAAQAVVAIARAAAEGGGWLSAVTIASTLIALTAGIAQARSIATDSVPTGLAKGTRFVDREGRHPYGVDKVPAMLNRGEAVFTTDQNREHGTLFDGLYYHDPKKVRDGLLATAAKFNLTDDLARRFGVGPVFTRRPLTADIVQGRRSMRDMLSPQAFTIVTGGGITEKQLVRLERAMRDSKSDFSIRHDAAGFAVSVREHLRLQDARRAKR